VERENELLREELLDAQKKLARDKKEIADLEKENSRLKRDLESTAQANNGNSLSTPSAMQPAYSKPSARKRRRKPGRKKGHPGACRPAPVRIDQTIEHTLSQCPICGSTDLGKPCGKHIRIIEDIPSFSVRDMLLKSWALPQTQLFSCRPNRPVPRYQAGCEGESGNEETFRRVGFELPRSP
jgi:hypothetical protein